MSLLEIKNLNVNYKTTRGEVHAVRGVDLSVAKGEVLAIVGESGCGKSALLKSMMGLLPANASVTGEVLAFDRELLSMGEKQMEGVRGRQISMLFQDPMTTLNPTMTIGSQIAEAILIHQPKMEKEKVQEKVYGLLTLVGIKEPQLRAKQYPYQFSGGMRQRSVLAIAIANEPQLLLADEPTTALDVTVQAQILRLLKEIQQKLNMTTILVSHDLRVVSAIADRVAVMYAGKIVEIGTRDEIFENPKHPYTWGLLRSLPEYSRGKDTLYTIPGMPPDLRQDFVGDAFAPRNRYALQIDYEEEPPYFTVSETHKAATWLLDERAPGIEFSAEELLREAAMEKHTHASGGDGTGQEAKNAANERPLVTVSHLTKEFILPGKKKMKAVKDVSFSILAGEIFGLVGESGSGKSTVARCIMNAYTDFSGEIFYADIPVHDRLARRKQAKRLSTERQMIFQDSASSLNGRMKVSDIVTEPFRIRHERPKRGSLKKEAAYQLSYVGMDEGCLSKHPGELSGGQRQRVAIARAVATDPKLLIADEPIAALDVSIQAQIINLFKHLQQEHGFSILFIAHDLAMVRFLCDRVGVMVDGELVEIGETEAIFSNPQHAYTKELLAAIPKIGKERP